MKAELTDAGQVILTAESEAESYMLKEWGLGKPRFDGFTTHISETKKMRSITLSFPKPEARER